MKTERRLTDAQKALVTDNLPLARHIAQKWITRGPTLRRMADDLHQQAVMGLMRASVTFDPRRSKFSTYAYYWADVYVGRHVLAMGRAVSLPGGAAPEVVKGMRTEPVFPETVKTDDAAEMEIARDLQVVRETFRRFAVDHYSARDVDLFLRVYFDGRTQAQEARAAGVSRERARQIYARMEGAFHRWTRRTVREEHAAAGAES